MPFAAVIDGQTSSRSLDTHERFIGSLIEHYARNLPLGLSSEQVRVLPIVD